MVKLMGCESSLNITIPEGLFRSKWTSSALQVVDN